MKIRKHVINAALATVGALFLPRIASAIGPDYQYIQDGVGGAPVATLNDIVDITKGGTNDGSGTVIGQTTIALSSTTSATVLSILTANHVAITAPNGIGFGAGPGSPGAPAFLVTGSLSGQFATYKLPGATLPEDMSIMQGFVTYPTGAVPAALANIIANVPTLSTGLANPSTTPNAPVGTGFTQFGYGVGGVFNPALPGYSQTGTSDARRFQNNTVTNATQPAGATYGPTRWFQPQIYSNVLAPTVPGGTGVGMQGDSGGPYFIGGTSTSVNVYPNYAGSPAGPVAVNVNKTNNLAAVFVAVDLDQATSNIAYTGQAPPYQNYAIPLLTGVQAGVGAGNGSYDWASSYATGGNATGNPLSIPEPGTLSLLAVGAAGLMSRRRRA